ncbi:MULTISPECIES: nucleotidyltransferase domain-containing protein [unclassified Flavobacterium]|uniref:nucleotidyltransferase domain-containing protein n=1 Tax=unclassified Flavobacterium TaxID=196869 RepID=UPI0026266E1C|nr:nucleotidyltransferase domain-containing protein [Flavobacterium sp.]
MKILKPILYFSIFNHPLQLEEVYSFSDHENRMDFDREIEQALQQGIITKTDRYYHTNLTTEHIHRRETGNRNAVKAMEKAQKKAQFISSWFPFVEAVAISGSLSKGYFDDNSDIDFFIISKPGYLWICRTCLVLYKKLFLFNSKKYFCVNYFITADNLEIEEKNRFTATEIVTLIPLYGKEKLIAFYESNQWVRSFFPNKTQTDSDSIRPIKKKKITAAFERFLSGSIGRRIEQLTFKTTFWFWKLKFERKLASEFSIAFKSSKRVSKHHPSNFQKKIIDALNQKYDDLNATHHIQLTKEHV